MQPVLNIRGRKPRQTAGFTLIEMMIVIAILAIIAAIAYPAYTDQVRKARRADAVSSIMSTAQYLERCFTRYNAYNHGDCTTPSTDSIDDYYTITVTRDATSFTISAAPDGDQANDPCKTLRITHLGQKTYTGTGARCWGSS